MPDDLSLGRVPPFDPPRCAISQGEACAWSGLCVPERCIGIETEGSPNYERFAPAALPLGLPTRRPPRLVARLAGFAMMLGTLAVAIGVWCVTFFAALYAIAAFVRGW